MRRPGNVLLLILVSALSMPAARFGVEDGTRIVRVTDPQISPDGKSVVAIVSRANLNDNRFDPELVLIDIAARTQRPLTRGRKGITSPRWSPDGARLAFLSNVDLKPQVMVMPMNGGDPLQLTSAPEGVQQFAWRPDGRALAFVAVDEPPKSEGEARHNKAFEAQNNDFLATTAPRPAHVWVVPADGGTARRITSGQWTLPQSKPPSSPSSPINWSPDGKTIVFVKLTTPYSGDGDQSSIQIVDAESGAVRSLTGRERNEAQPLFSPDGSSVAYWYPREGQTRNVNEIWVAPVGGGEGRSVTRTIDRNIMRSIWMPGAKSLLVSANDGTGVSIWVQPLEGAAKKVALGDLVPTAAFWLDASANSKGQVVFTATAPSRPAEVYYLPSPDAKPERLTDLNDATAKLELGRSETIEWNGPDGFRQDGVITFPPDYVSSRKYPLVLYIHGGPRSASKRAFSARVQLLAAQGWIVFEPNYRGSDNLGNAFQAAIWNDAGAGPGRDVMSGVEEVIRKGYVDESRMAVSGWSYGGYMTTWLLGNYPAKWKAAVAGAAVTDWRDQYHLGDANVRRGQAFGGSPWTDPKRMQAMMEQSPITYGPKIKAPTLILCNTGDYRVPITQSYALYHVLRDNNVPTQFIAYPLSGHSPTDPVHMRDVDRRWVHWLKRHLEGTAEKQTSE